MELWIRSQNKLSLTKVNSVVIDFNDQKKLVANYIQFNGDEDYTPLGEYDTEERALEVLDEIQCHLVNINDSRDSYFYVYEMPYD